MIQVRNPRTGRDDYQFAPATEADLDAHAASLREAQRDWAALPVEARVAVLRRWGDAVEAASGALIEALIHDTGRFGETHAEMNLFRGTLARWLRDAPAQLATFDERASAVETIKLAGQLVPYPLVGVISPWNFPLGLSVIDAIPALLAGSAVLVKPSEVTPRFVEPLIATINQVPELAAVLRYVLGDGKVGAALIERVDMVVFTGSVATGRNVGEACARNFIPAFLELGGKDPAIILPGADLDRATSALAWGATANAGQACQSIERIYVHRSLHDRFVTQLADKLRRLKLAFPKPNDGEIGPVIFARQAEILRAQLDDAKAKGAVVVTGGELQVLEGGTYLLPTLLTKVDHTMLVMTEETFGPILPVMAFDTVEQAVALANDSVYGLSAAVFAASEQEAELVARRLDAGAVSINDATLTAVVSDGEKMSFKLSGLGGSRMGPTSIRRFLRQKLLIKSRGAGPQPWWFRSLA
ncbi:aldehyde dehydrogenase family protein [Roseiterribacter gracilis]|uniref:Aldehyde dehydrogenase n=1 Tax=Roseiterribacter gracilis TaxID=2812848 RepID=A0A8S8XE43_9PROT|nr:aldehyde dehydrogenase [Rhodospirillales bacterium TMPK1]